MDYQDGINQLLDLRERCKGQIKIEHAPNDPWAEDVKALDIAIQALEKQLNDKWIPVSERLPEVRQYEDGEPIEFIAMIKDAVVPTALSIDDNGSWFDMQRSISDDYNVIAWKPLPEPYLEWEKEEEFQMVPEEDKYPYDPYYGGND
ncbi:DUF551 domain-containing protein [Tissierella pigra]|uniref:DUF551 domain-containing protein n=1 Tax=Tissierella pigra TaxID=2607614 RepID=A0A6N7XMA0_9FIRM|nr:DUF551 domain-containing protein [Tissierella pigra]MSU01912.1 DUF551 domain-containing protein [Tissierella pigra]